MKMFSDCSGPCETCYIHYTGGCLAGHGDDDYIYASPKEIVELKKASKVEAKAQDEELNAINEDDYLKDNGKDIILEVEVRLMLNGERYSKGIRVILGDEENAKKELSKVYDIAKMTVLKINGYYEKMFKEKGL